MQRSILAALAATVFATTTGTTATEPATDGSTETPPVLHLSTQHPEPETRYNLVFPAEVKPNVALGETVPNDVLSIVPPLPGKVRWLGRSECEFLPDQAPAIGTEYKFATFTGLEYADGSPVPAVHLLTAAPLPLDVSRNPRIISKADSRRPTFLVTFNLPVDPQRAASIYFEDSNNRRVGAEGRTWTRQGLKASSHYTPPTWQERFELHVHRRDPQPQPRPGAVPGRSEMVPMTHVLVAKPAVPLPEGENWRLVIPAGFTGPDGAAPLTRDTHSGSYTVRAFGLQSAHAATEPDRPRKINLHFSSTLPGNWDWSWLENHVRITPPPGGDITVKLEGRTVELHADYSDNDAYTVRVRPGLVAANGLTMDKQFETKVAFRHLVPSAGLQGFDQPQQAHGNLLFPVYSTNLSAVRVRAKLLQGEHAVRAVEAYAHYVDGSVRGTEGDGLLPYELVVGRNVTDHTAQVEKPVDSTHQFDLNWRDLLPPDVRSGVLFVHVEGTAHPEAAEAYPGKRPVTQAVVQLTDIGLAWKLASDHAGVYAFSCETGAPLAGLALDVFGDDATPVASATTGSSGFARVERSEGDRHLRASLGGDTFVTRFDHSLPTLTMWRFPVNWTYRPHDWERIAQLTTDRSLYRPGETVHLKAVVRRLAGNRLTAEPADTVFRLRVLAPDRKEVLTGEVTASELGTFHRSFKLDGERTGYYRVQLDVPAELARLDEIGRNDYYRRQQVEQNARFEHQIYVADFRRNAFEVETSVTPPPPGAGHLAATVTASTMTGLPLADADLKWFATARETGFYPDGYRDYLFGNHGGYDREYWRRYYGSDLGRRYGSPNRAVDSARGEATLDHDGNAIVAVPVPAGGTSPRTVTVGAEVTDPNHQTLHHSASTTLHPSEFYIGVSRPRGALRAGQPHRFKLVAVRPDGSVFEDGTWALLEGYCDESVQVKMRNPEGVVTVQHETRRHDVGAWDLIIRGGADHAAGGTGFDFTPEHPGTYRLRVTAHDPEGREVKTRFTFRCYGDDYRWAYSDETRIDLVPEEPLYRPGDTARVLVVSPVEGTALVTVERDGVRRHFSREIAVDDPFVDVPLEDADAPTAYVSVVVVKGSRDNQRKAKEPILRTGYCQINIEPTSATLAVGLEPPGGPVRPGDTTTISGYVRGPDGAPVSGAEVLLYAVDEGTLAVKGYQNPDPLALFYKPRPLTTRAGHSLDRLLPESAEDVYFGNKGFFVGGGGDAELPGTRVRRDFDPCALWEPALATGDDGRFSATFTAPDTLTRYRVIAVALAGHERFGTSVGEFTVDKPLMLEPGVPHYASEGDSIFPRATVRNASGRPGVWRVSLATSDNAGVVGEASKRVPIAAGATAVVPFGVVFHHEGTATLQWSAEPLEIDGAPPAAAVAAELTDAVESEFEVTYPVPELRSTRWVKVAPGQPPVDLLANLAPDLRNGRGRIDLDLSRSRLLDAGSALDHLLRYPYGCLEQTSSSLLPWLTVHDLKNVVPGFAGKSPADIAAAIQGGADRLLSMQLASGGFGYWPRDTRATDWATPYAGMVLLLAREAGASVPDSAVDALVSHLSKSLRGAASSRPGRTPFESETDARAVYCLALAGHPDPAYMNVLRDRLPQLTPSARACLALAFHRTGQTREAASLLRDPTPAADLGDEHWTRHSTDPANVLLAWSTIAPDDPETSDALDAVLAKRNPFGHWSTTYVNGWTLLALGAYGKHVEAGLSDAHATLTTPDGVEQLVLGAGGTAATRRLTFALDGGPPLGLTLATTDSPVFVRVAATVKPEIAPAQPVAPNGLSVVRTYQRILDDGRAVPLENPQVNDLVRVNLAIQLPERRWNYLVVEDRLPSVFEPIDSAFTSQGTAGRRAPGVRNWRVSHRELRSDRALFFINHVPSGGRYSVSYTARVTSVGEAFAPAAKVEEMYDPEMFALSSARTFAVPEPD